MGFASLVCFVLAAMVFAGAVLCLLNEIRFLMSGICESLDRLIEQGEKAEVEPEVVKGKGAVCIDVPDYAAALQREQGYGDG